MDNKEYIIGIDIGSSSVVMAAGVRNEDGEVSVLGVEVQEVGDCVKDGDVINYRELGTAISNAKSALESELGRRVNSAYVAISGRSVYCVRYEDYVDINERTGCVTENELRELDARIKSVVAGGGDDIIERIPLRYCIDGRQDVKNPLGAYGRKLSATYLFVLVGKQQVDLVSRALYSAEIKISGLCVSPTLLPEILLRPDESEEGVMIVDIGSDLTDISIVKEGKLWYFLSLPIGASSINNDLHEFLKIPKRDIEQLKKRYGSAVADGVPDNTTIPVKTAGHAKKQILQRNVAEIAEERLKDIARFIKRELKAAKFSTKIPYGMVLTGGSAYLSNIDQLFSRELEMEVRFGQVLNGLDDNSQQIVCANLQSVVAGLLLYGSKHSGCDTVPGGVNPMEKKPKEEEIHNGGRDIFSTPVPPSNPQPEPQPKPEPQPDPAPVPEPKQEPEPTPEPASEPQGEEDVDGKENVDISEQVEDKEPEQLNKGGKSGRGWMKRFGVWLDELFNDEYL